MPVFVQQVADGASEVIFGRAVGTQEGGGERRGNGDIVFADRASIRKQGGQEPKCLVTGWNCQRRFNEDIFRRKVNFSQSSKVRL
jgi:hypothetical protein